MDLVITNIFSEHCFRMREKADTAWLGRDLRAGEKCNAQCLSFLIHLTMRSSTLNPFPLFLSKYENCL